MTKNISLLKLYHIVSTFICGNQRAYINILSVPLGGALSKHLTTNPDSNGKETKKSLLLITGHRHMCYLTESFH